MPGSRNSISSAIFAPRARIEFSLPGMAHATIIIPAYNSGHIITRTLRELWKQVVPEAWTMEVLISDDGSTDRTAALAREATPPPGWQVRVLTGPHGGAAVARNRACAAATGTVVILLQADIELRPGALQAHLQFHQDHPETTAAGLGFIVWDPRLPPSRLMMWMMHGGHHNNFDALLGRTLADPQHFFYGAFVSVKRELLVREKFSEEFTGYGWEDLELGRRLARHGLALHVLPAARALHVHRYSVADICQRQLATGKNLPVYQRLQPGQVIAPTPSRSQRLRHTLAFWLGVPLCLKYLVTFSERYWVTPRLFAWLTAVYFWQGWYAAKSLSEKPLPTAMHEDSAANSESVGDVPAGTPSPDSEFSHEPRAFRYDKASRTGSKARK